MSELPVVDKTVRVKFVYDLGSELGTTFSIYFLNSANISQAQADSLAVAAHTAYGAHMPAVHSAAAVYTGTVVEDLSDKAGPIAYATGSAPGTLGGPELPANACVLVNFSIKRRYRGGKPRVYVPAGSSSSLTTPQTWSPAFITSFNTAWTGLITDIKANLASWSSSSVQAAVSYYSGSSWSGPDGGPYKQTPTKRHPPLSEPIIATAVSAIVGSQRGRLRQG